MRGQAYEKKIDYGRALADYDEVLKSNPKNVEALSSRARTYEKKDACDRAVLDYGEMIRLAPASSWEGYVGRARCHAKLGDRNRAIADYRAALQLGLPDAVKPTVLSALAALGVTP